MNPRQKPLALKNRHPFIPLEINFLTGFTLIEILLVLLLFGVFAGLAIPQFGPTYSRLQLKETAEDLVYLMRYAQSRAIVRQKKCGLQFDSQMTSYWLIEDRSDPEESLSIESFERMAGRFGRIYHVPEKITIEADETLIRFYPDGTMDKVNIYVSNNREEVFTISTFQKTGQVQIFNSKI